jgi:hypothetical protein
MLEEKIQRCVETNKNGKIILNPSLPEDSKPFDLRHPVSTRLNGIYKKQVVCQNKVRSPA